MKYEVDGRNVIKHHNGKFLEIVERFDSEDKAIQCCELLNDANVYFAHVLNASTDVRNARTKGGGRLTAIQALNELL